MIHEYALEPELVATWHTDLHYNYFIRCFGFDPEDGRATGRVVAQYPENWQEKVWDAFSANSGQSADYIKMTRITELLKRFGEPEVYRLNKDTWSDQRTWLENAEHENTRHPFHAILACDNPRNNSNVVRGDDVLNDTPHPLWRVRPEISVERQAMEMANHLEPMLRCATRILFIDPHFNALTNRYKKPLREFLRIICDGRREVKLEYHTSADYKNAPSWDEFQQECQDALPDIIPRGFELTVRRWEERPRGERLHNRYILTDIGGVQFPHGLDEGTGTDDIFRLSREIYRKRCNDYGHSGSNPAFDLEGEAIVITGRSRP